MIYRLSRLFIDIPWLLIFMYCYVIYIVNQLFNLIILVIDCWPLAIQKLSVGLFLWPFGLLANHGPRFGSRVARQGQKCINRARAVVEESLFDFLIFVGFSDWSKMSKIWYIFKLFESLVQAWHPYRNYINHVHSYSHLYEKWNQSNGLEIYR